MFSRFSHVKRVILCIILLRRRLRIWFLSLNIIEERAQAVIWLRGRRHTWHAARASSRLLRSGKLVAHHSWLLLLLLGWHHAGHPAASVRHHTHTGLRLLSSTLHHHLVHHLLHSHHLLLHLLHVHLILWILAALQVHTLHLLLHHHHLLLHHLHLLRVLSLWLLHLRWHTGSHWVALHHARATAWRSSHSCVVIASLHQLVERIVACLFLHHGVGHEAGLVRHEPRWLRWCRILWLLWRCGIRKDVIKETCRRLWLGLSLSRRWLLYRHLLNRRLLRRHHLLLLWWELLLRLCCLLGCRVKIGPVISPFISETS